MNRLQVSCPHHGPLSLFPHDQAKPCRLVGFGFIPALPEGLREGVSQSYIQPMRIVFLAALLFTARQCMAHADPLGETHPHVTANQDGSFTVTFNHHIGEEQTRMRMMLGADGKEAVPRHRIKKDMEPRDVEIPSNVPPGIRMVTAGKEEAQTQTLLVNPAANKSGKTGALTLPLRYPAYVHETPVIAGKEVAVAYGEPVERTEGMPLNLTWCRTDGFQSNRTVTLGKVACIYDFPRISPPVWSAGRWWVTWVEVRRREEAFTWTTVLSCVDPQSGKVEHHDLPGISNWNTSLDIAVNAAGTFCVAWHASLDGSYPGTAKIVTAVFTPKK